jgi:hypothetical protein
MAAGDPDWVTTTGPVFCANKNGLDIGFSFARETEMAELITLHRKRMCDRTEGEYTAVRNELANKYYYWGCLRWGDNRYRVRGLVRHS